MADTNAVFNDALAKVKEAIDADRAKDYTKALDLYEKALERFLHVITYSKSEVQKKSIGAKAEEYMVRAEYLKKIIKDGHDGGAAAAGGSASATKGDPAAEEGMDAEQKRLMGGLAGAVVSEKPNVKWTDVAGLAAAKAALYEAVIMPVKFPQLFQGKRKPWQGILMYGPPGTGKSYLAKAVATEADSHFLAVSSSDLVSKWQGESEKLVRALFALARAKKPSIIFIDECDSLCGSRSGDQSDSSRRVLNEFLVQMQGVGKDNQGVLVLGATNTPWSIDAAMRRRFQKRIYIPLPDADARRVMFNIHIGKTLHTLGDSDFDSMGVMSEGMSGSDISHVVNEALYEPVRRIRGATHFRRDRETGKYEPCDPRAPGAEAKTIADLEGDDLGVPKVTAADFVQVMKRAKATVGADELKQFDDWTKEFGEEGN